MQKWWSYLEKPYLCGRTNKTIIIMKTKRSLLLVILLSIMLIHSFGQGNEPGGGNTITIDGLKYILNEDSHTAMVANGNTWEGELVIPEQVIYDGEKYTVSMIEWLAFNSCATLTKVRIPKTIVEIRHYAGYDDCKNPFTSCTSLERIEVDEENPSMCSVDGVLFSRDTTQLFCYPAGAKATAYTVPYGVTWIGGYALHDNNYLKAVTIPNSVTRMCFGMFSGCRNLESVSLSENLTYLPAYLFTNCTSLKSIEIPSGVTVMGEQVFLGCTSLTSVTLPEGVNSAGSLTFKDCTSLQSVSLPHTLGEICHGMFGGCSSLKDIKISSGTTRVYMSAFQGCTSLRVLDLPPTITWLDPVSFKDCNMEALVIRGTLTHWYENIFDGMSTSTVIYTPSSQVSKMRNIYSGTVRALSYYNPEDYIQNSIHDLPAPQVANDNYNNGIFDLSGRRLSTPPAKGVYIEKGRKRLTIEH